NRRRASVGIAEISMGIGLNYGPAVLGDLGGEHGMAFACVGDTVNTSSRLQDLTRIFRTTLLVVDPPGRATQPSLKQRAVAVRERRRPVGEQLLRGRTRPIKVWTLPASLASAGTE